MTILTLITPKSSFGIKRKKNFGQKKKNFRAKKFFFEKFLFSWKLLKKLGKKNSKWLFWMPNGMFLKKKSWNFEKIHVFKISHFCRNQNYRTFPTSTIPKGKIRFVRFHMMSHLRKISFEPSNVPWESNLSADPCAYYVVFSVWTLH